VAVATTNKLLIINHLVAEEARASVGRPEAVRCNALKTGHLYVASGRLIIDALLVCF